MKAIYDARTLMVRNGFETFERKSSVKLNNVVQGLQIIGMGYDQADQPRCCKYWSLDKTIVKKNQKTT